MTVGLQCSPLALVETISPKARVTSLRGPPPPSWRPPSTLPCWPIFSWQCPTMHGLCPNPSPRLGSQTLAFPAPSPGFGRRAQPIRKFLL